MASSGRQPIPEKLLEGWCGRRFDSRWEGWFYTTDMGWMFMKNIPEIYPCGDTKHQCLSICRPCAMLVGIEW